MERENKTKRGQSGGRRTDRGGGARDTSYDISLMYTKRHLNPGSTVMWVKRNHTGTVRYGSMMKRKEKRKLGKNLTKASASEGAL